MCCNKIELTKITKIEELIEPYSNKCYATDKIMTCCARLHFVKSFLYIKRDDNRAYDCL